MNSFNVQCLTMFFLLLFFFQPAGHSGIYSPTSCHLRVSLLNTCRHFQSENYSPASLRNYVVVLIFPYLAYGYKANIELLS